MQVCQIFYHTLQGDVTEYKSSKYQHNKDIQPSLLFTELGIRDDNQMKLDFDKAASGESRSDAEQAAG